MGKIFLMAIILLSTQISILLMIPEEHLQTREPELPIASRRKPPESLTVRQVELSPDGILRITYVKEMGMQTFHHFINVRSGNVILVEDDDLRPKLVLIAETLQGGLEITVSRSWNLDLDQFKQATGPDSQLPPH